MDIVGKKFGNKLKELRKKNDLSQSALAEKIGVDEKYISRLETASSTPSFSMIVKLSGALSIEPKMLFTFDYMRPKDELINDIMIKLKKTSESNVQLIYKMVEGVID